MIHKSVEQFTKAMTFQGITTCPQDGHWEIPTDSDICTEVETIALVFGFVRALRPKLVVETGCNVGVMSQAICSALIANDKDSVLYTCDIEPNLAQTTFERCRVIIGHRIAVYVEGGLDLVTRYPDANLYFIDSSEDSRVKEIEWLRDHGKKGAIVLVHDTTCYGYMSEIIKGFPQRVILPGPRGLGVIVL